MALKKIGALWINTPREGGEQYLSGTLEENNEKRRIKVFKNKFKKPGSKDPDFRILLEEPDEVAPPNSEPTPF